jgi:hypothetical protein
MAGWLHESSCIGRLKVIYMSCIRKQSVGKSASYKPILLKGVRWAHQGDKPCDLDITVGQLVSDRDTQASNQGQNVGVGTWQSAN